MWLAPRCVRRGTPPPPHSLCCRLPSLVVLKRASSGAGVVVAATRRGAPSVRREPRGWRPSRCRVAAACAPVVCAADPPAHGAGAGAAADRSSVLLDVGARVWWHPHRARRLRAVPVPDLPRRAALRPTTPQGGAPPCRAAGCPPAVWQRRGHVCGRGGRGGWGGACRPRGHRRLPVVACGLKVVRLVRARCC